MASTDPFMHYLTGTATQFTLDLARPPFCIPSDRLVSCVRNWQEQIKWKHTCKW